MIGRRVEIRYLRPSASGGHRLTFWRFQPYVRSELAKIDTQPLTPPQAAMSATAALATSQEIPEPEIPENFIFPPSDLYSDKHSVETELHLR
jgi:hypothetical protein